MARPLPAKPSVEAAPPFCQTTVINATTTTGPVTVFCDLAQNHEGPHASGGVPLSLPKSIYNNK